MKQTLYHGGSHIIEKPEIREPNRTLDFGKGFYVTSSQNQAERWVKGHLREKFDVGYVNLYEFDQDTLPMDLNIKIFSEANEEWIDFVLANRLTMGYEHNYDIVVGPVANDNVYAQITLFEGGIISKERLIDELKSYKLVDQYLFHTEKSLSQLRYISHYPVDVL